MYTQKESSYSWQGTATCTGLTLACSDMNCEYVHQIMAVVMPCHHVTVLYLKKTFVVVTLHNYNLLCYVKKVNITTAI